MSEALLYIALGQSAANTLHEMLHIAFVQLAKDSTNPIELRPYVEIMDIVDDAMKKLPAIILTPNTGAKPDA